MTQSGHFQMREKSGDQGCHAKFAPRLLENEPCSLQSTFDPKQTCAGGFPAPDLPWLEGMAHWREPWNKP